MQQLLLLLVAAGATIDLLFLALGYTERRFDEPSSFPLIWAVFIGFLAVSVAAVSLPLTNLIENFFHILVHRQPVANYGPPPSTTEIFLFAAFLAELASAAAFYPLGVKLFELAGLPRPALAAAERPKAVARPTARAAVWRGPGVQLGRDGRLYVLVKKGRERA